MGMLNPYTRLRVYAEAHPLNCGNMSPDKDVTVFSWWITASS